MYIVHSTSYLFRGGSCEYSPLATCSVEGAVCTPLVTCSVEGAVCTPLVTCSVEGAVSNLH